MTKMIVSMKGGNVFVNNKNSNIKKKNNISTIILL